MPKPGTVYFKDGTRDEAAHVDVRDNWVHYQQRVDGNVYSHMVPREDVERVKRHLGTVEECQSVKDVEQGAHP